MSKLNMNRLGFFALGTFAGPMVIGLFGRVLGRKA